ncbi:acetylornithine transaminase [bacterium]|nr:MAG: acetylornithine transaminase [bacterium]
MNLTELQELDSQHAFQNYGTRLPYAFTKGEGARLWDSNGNEYLDFLGGIAVVVLGHNHPKVTEAISKQASQILHTSNFFYIEPQVKLATKLAEMSGGMRAVFCNSGAEANEAAIKIARRYAYDRGETERVEIVTLEKSFHGRTLGALAATGQPKYQEGFAPLPLGFKHVPLGDIEALRAAVSSKTALVMFETILGESGVLMLSKEYIEAARQICDENGALLAIDEVQCGCGRTGKFFAHEWYGVKPDMIPMAKGLANGVPIGAVLAREEVALALKPGSHGTTFGGNFLASAAALATLEALEEEKLMENATRVGDYFQSRLRDWGATVGAKEVRGLGLMVGVELDSPNARKLMLKSLENGLVFNAVGDTILRFLPPLNISTADVDEAMEKLQKSWAEIEK